MNLIDYSSRCSDDGCDDGYSINVIKDTNSIYFNGDINSTSMERLTNELLTMEISINKKIKKIQKILDEANAKIKEQKVLIDDVKIDLTNNVNINLYITTYGGCVYSAFGIIDTIKSMKIPVHTICKGCVASAGTLISLSGKKRFITKHSYMLIHELRTGCWGKFTYFKDNYTNSQDLMNCIRKYYVENSKISNEEIVDQLKQDIMWDATNCLEKGLVDEII